MSNDRSFEKKRKDVLVERTTYLFRINKIIQQSFRRVFLSEKEKTIHGLNNEAKRNIKPWLALQFTKNKKNEFF